jgi:hypothetical protein
MKFYKPLSNTKLFPDYDAFEIPFETHGEGEAEILLGKFNGLKEKYHPLRKRCRGIVYGGLLRREDT